MDNKTNGQNKIFVPSNKLMIVKLAILFFLFADFYLSNLIFILNTGRTIASGIYQVLWLQFPMMFIILILNRYELNTTQNEIKERIGVNINQKSKAPLFKDVGEEIEENKEDSYTLKDIIYYLIAFDLLFVVNFLFYGFFFADILLFTALAVQGYFLVPVIILYVIYTRMKFPDKLKKEDHLIIDQRSIIRKLLDMSPKNKKTFIFIILVLILAISTLWSVPFQEDFHSDTLDITEGQEFTSFETHSLKKINDKIHILGTMEYPNYAGRLFPKLTHVVIEDNKVVSSQILTNLGRVNESIVDIHTTNSEIYLLMLNDDFFQFNILKFDFKTGGLTHESGFQLNNTIATKYYHQLAITDDQFITISSPYRPDLWGPSSLILFSNKTNPDFVMSTTYDVPIWESTVFKDTLRLIIRPKNQSTYFEETTLQLPLFENTSSFSSAQTLVTPQNEIQNQRVNPNGVTYHIIEDELYYVSSHNIYSITSQIGIQKPLNLVQEKYTYTFRTFQGFSSSNEYLILNAGSRIFYINSETYRVDQSIHALHSNYEVEFKAPIEVSIDKILTLSQDNILYFWEVDINQHIQHERYITGLLVSSGILYSIGLITVLWKWSNQYKLKINTSNIN